MAQLLLFTAFTPDHGWELWKSDGSESGTTLVRDLVPGPASGVPHGTVAVGDTAYFFAQSGGRIVLWASTGSLGGTAVVDPLAATDGLAGPVLSAVGDGLYFAADDGSHGPELWLARPGQAPATMVVDLLPGGEGAMPVPIGVLGDRLVFAADAADGARALWCTDGTAEGTWRLTGTGVDAADSVGVAIDGSFHFIASDADHGSEVWQTDGTLAGTRRVTDLPASPAGELAVLDATLYFRAAAAGGEELWRLDGDAAALVKDIREGVEDSAPRDFAVLDGVLYFTAVDGSHGRELWRSDGTEEGTWLVADIAEGGATSNPAGLVAAGGRLLFAAEDGHDGIELWTSDGTAAGTVRAAEVNASGSGSPGHLVVLEVASTTLDVTPPDTFIRSGPPPVDPATAAFFELGSDEAGVIFQAALDGGPWQPGGDRLTLADLAPGSHMLLVRAIDEAGNVDPTPVQYQWAVGAPSADTTAPETTILSGPPTNGAGDTASFAFGSDEGEVAYQAAIDGGPFLTVVNPLAMQGLSPGVHTLLARAIDPSGNVDATPAIYSWFVGDDLEAPDTTIASGPASTTTATVAVFDLAATEEGVRFEGRLDDGGWQTVTDPVALSGLAAGGHSFQARAVDAAGHVDASTATWSWTVSPVSPAADPEPRPHWSGADLVVYSHADADALLPDAGIRSIQAYASLRLPEGVANFLMLGAAALNADGNELANAMVGNAAGNILASYGGNDSVIGDGGDDFLAVGTGDDTVGGDDPAGLYAGDDTVWGGQGNDSILGGGGGDLLNGDRGADTLLGGTGDDVLSGGADGDRLDGGDGGDVLRGGQGDDLMQGGAGADTVGGDLGADTLRGGADADVFVLAADGSIDVVGDFIVGLDRLQFAAATGITDEATFRARTHAADEATLIDLGGGGWALLQGVRPEQIQPGDLLIV